MTIIGRAAMPRRLLQRITKLRRRARHAMTRADDRPASTSRTAIRTEARANSTRGRADVMVVRTIAAAPRIEPTPPALRHGSVIGRPIRIHLSQNWRRSRSSLPVIARNNFGLGTSARRSMAVARAGGQNPFRRCGFGREGTCPDQRRAREISWPRGQDR